jgi:hypothetical protein
MANSAAQDRTLEALVQPLDALRSRLIGLKVAKTWRAISRDVFPSVPPGTLCAIAKGRDPKKIALREALGLPVSAETTPANGVVLVHRPVVLRSEIQCGCGCGSWLVPGSWNQAYLPGHRKHRRRR